MRNQWYRAPEHDNKRWFAREIAETDGFNIRYRPIPRPTIRGVAAFLFIGVPAMYLAMMLISFGGLILYELVYGPAV